MQILRGFLGVIVLLGIAYLFSKNKKQINWRTVSTGMAFQLVLAVLAFKTTFFSSIFAFVAKAFVKVYEFTAVGSSFIFGNLVITHNTEWGWVFAIQVLPSLIFFSALFSLLYYIGILPFIINFFSMTLRKVMGISGAESLAAAGNVFLGQSETPLLIKPLLQNLTRSEMNCLIVGGFATISGAILGSAAGMLGGEESKEFFAQQFLIASILSAPAAIVVSKIMVPETEDISTYNYKLDRKQTKDKNALDAISSGTFDGLKLAMNVGAMVLVFVALIAFVNYLLFKFGVLTGLNAHLPYTEDGLSLEYVFGFIFMPFAWLLGADPSEMMVIGSLIGEKTAINEFVAYGSMKEYIDNGKLVTERGKVIATYALCGFSNFSSIGIMIGGITALAPERRNIVAELALKGLIGATIACLITAAIAGMFF